jgi:hypothetical protein
MKWPEYKRGIAATTSGLIFVGLKNSDPNLLRKHMIMVLDASTGNLYTKKSNNPTIL